MSTAAVATAPEWQMSTPMDTVAPPVEQLRHAIGEWMVETDFIGPDGKIQGTLEGHYKFKWVVPDKIVSGVSEIPAMKQISAILFFHRPASREIEMSSVGPDGKLWRMIGPEDSETRTTSNQTMPDGSTLMLRFTRHSVTPDSFGSTMELSTDSGETWRIGNQQRFVRAVNSPSE
ncbi:hypothetical protein [Parasphingorhabdus halotolerans]|uniref:DUF1579 domain-containing protein n=1 Tax=Parasphingorhabdus halotolerans TaxID=2725558 RepID=A0A6H2DJ17_9SPHN|nr:hypothetical protein [Parasphingorhabdus halotolerans]QJB68137.1 hypothetical protein HF685_01445 [Parasphingorhabdus halotolerans]